MTASHQPPNRSSTRATATWPLSLGLSRLACMLNFELADHPVYDGGELQWFDDEQHGTGMLVFLSRRQDRSVDYYQQPGLRLDRDGYHLGGGTRSWTECDFDVAHLEMAADGVQAEVRFRDVDGRLVEIRVDDRDGRRRRRAGLLAPVSAGIAQPRSLMLVWMPAFDLVRVSGTPPVIRIDGDDADTGRLPGRRIHRRHLVKYAAPVLTLHLNRDHDGPLSAAATDEERVVDVDGRLTTLVARRGQHRATLALEPGLPALDALTTGAVHRGRWHVRIDEATLTGGSWSLTVDGSTAHMALDVDERWRPGRLPWLMRLVTTVVPVFRRWPTTYRWQADVRLDDPPTMTSRWQRTDSGLADAYRRTTGS